MTEGPGTDAVRDAIASTMAVEGEPVIVTQFVAVAKIIRSSGANEIVTFDDCDFATDALGMHEFASEKIRIRFNGGAR